MKAMPNTAFRLIVSFLTIVTAIPAKAQQQDNMKPAILFVVTSHDKKGDTGEPTGSYLSEVTHPWDVLIKTGYEIEFVSPKGGKAPVDGLNLADPVNKRFWNDPAW